MIIFQKSLIKKITPLILIICIIGVMAGPILLYPKKAQAVAGCTVNVAASKPQSSGNALLDWILGLTAAFKAGNLAALAAQLAELIWRNAKLIIEWTLGVFLNLLLHQILAQLTNDIVNWIQNGTEPRFLTMGLDDWLGMAVDNALGNFIDQYLGIGWLCEPFDIDIKIALLKQPTFKEEARCSISDIVGNIEDFYNDFSVGGWGGWIKLTEGGNNVYSTYLIAIEEIQKIQTKEEKEQEAEIARGSGFFSPKDCVWYDGNNKPIDLVVESSGKRYTSGYNDVWGTPALPGKCAPSANILAEPFETDGLHKDGSSVVGPCYKKCISHTPGKQISDSVSKTVNRFWDTINAQIGAASAKAGPYSIYVEAILTALVNRAFKEGYGLLFAQNQSIPGEGDCGAACELPKIIDPTEIKQDVAAAKLLKPELSTIKVALDKLLKEQKDNLAVWNLIVKKYEDILLILDDMTKDHPLGCGETSYDPSYITWAKNKKIEVDDIISTIKNTNIKNLTDIIAKTVLQINNIDNIIIPAINAYIDAVDVWEKAYEDSGGTTNDDVEKALKALNDAKNIAILAVQNLFKAIMGTSTGTTFTELKAESYLVFDQIYVLIDQYYTERGTSAFPEPGTIWGDYETAVELEEDAQGRLDKCQTWGN